MQQNTKFPVYSKIKPSFNQKFYQLLKAFHSNEGKRKKESYFRFFNINRKCNLGNLFTVMDEIILINIISDTLSMTTEWITFFFLYYYICSLDH